MTAPHDEGDQPHRVTTGVPGLDEVLKGGVFAGAVYIVRGAPGAGKTILANQICFHHAKGEGQALFVSLLAESHARMLQHMERMSFYAADAVPKKIYYVSAFRTLEEEGLKGLMDLLRREMRAHDASLLVLDGLLAVEESSGSDREFRKFIQELQGHAAINDCAALLLTNGSRAEFHPEHTMVDGLITLDDVLYGKRKQRELEVRKFRGSAALRGRHSFRITDDGITVFPRAESRFGALSDDVFGRRLSTGIPALDGMICGGLPQGTTSLLLGASGTGKTTMGAHFVSRSTAEEPGLYFGFYETPNRLIANAASVGLDLKKLVDDGHLEILWHVMTEQILDDLADNLIKAVRRRGVKRLVVDGMGGYIAAADLPTRVTPFFAALSNELRALNVTTIYTGETRNLVGPEVTVPIEGVSTISENMILLRFIEHKAQLHRLISVMKVRSGGFDPHLREFHITDSGIAIASGFKSAEALLSTTGSERKFRARLGPMTAGAGQRSRQD